MSHNTVCTNPPHHAELECLRRVSVFNRLDAGTLRALAAGMRQEVHRRGDLLRGDDTPHNDLFIIERGLVALYATSTMGHETILAVLKPGDAFGFVPFQARILVQNTVLFRLPWHQRRHLMSTCPAVSQALYDLACQRLKQAREHMALIARHDVKTRLARVLMELTDEEPEVPLTHADLAALIASRQDEVTKALRYFRQLGLVDAQPYRHGLVVRDAQALAAHAAGSAQNVRGVTLFS